MKKLISIVAVLILLISDIEVFAQGCPMCKTALEEARNNGSSVGNTLNNGILYLLAIPYIIAMVFGIIWYKNSRAKKASL